MASTQKLTELPVIQATGMDYTTVISQIKEIIENNTNWASNWTQFYNSEAGTLLIQLMAWICDNLAVRQDLLYNESFLATATSDAAKYRLLKQIGYSKQSRSATILPISIEFTNVTKSDINLSNVRDNKNDLTEIKSSIFKFYGQNKNNKSVPYEILKLDEDGKPDYTYSIKLSAGSIYYTEDADGNKLTALQGNTVYREFESDTSDGPVFELESDIDINSVKVYDLESGKLHQMVENFIDTDVVQGNLICYILELNESGNYQIRYPSRDLVTYNNDTLSDRLFDPTKKICVFYRTCEGGDSNIAASFISVEDNVIDINGDSNQIKIVNVSAGYNGKDQETLDNAVKNAPLTLTSLNRAVTSEDYNRLLKRNSLVLNSKSFTPDNMPGAFEKYFGRKISPHEVFSFVVLNREINNIPNSKLNYYPWIELNKNHVLNEKYIFGNASMNNLLTYKDKYLNYYIKDSYYKYKGYEYNSIYDKGQWYEKNYNVKSSDKILKARMLPNAIIFDTNDDISETILSEKSNNEYNLKIKLHEAESEELYINDIVGIDGSKNSLTTKNNIVETETNASYTSTNEKDVIDCRGYKYFKFVLDDLFVINVDLQQEAKDLYPSFNNIHSDWIEGKKPIEYYEKYYLYLDNEPITTSDYEYALQQEKKYGGKTNDYYIAMYNYHNSREYAGYRKGIVQLIREALSEIVNYTVEIDYNNPTGALLSIKNSLGNKYSKVELCKKIIELGELKQIINNYTFIYKLANDENDEYYVIQYKTKLVENTLGAQETVVDLAKVLKLDDNEKTIGLNESINATEEIDFTKQQLMYNSMFANGTSSFVDMNLQKEKQDEREYLKQVYIATTDAITTFYTPEEKKDFYRIRVGNRIFAIRLDAYSIINAYNFYKRLSLNNDAFEGVNGVIKSYIYDYFPYFGKGDMLYGLKDSEIIKYANKELDYKYSVKTIDYAKDVAATLEKVYNSAFSKIKLGEVEEAAGIEPGLSIEYNTTKNEQDTNNINYVEFTLKNLVNVMEYIFSPVNVDKDTIFEFKNGKWYDLKTSDLEEIKEYYEKEKLTEDDIISYRTVLGGNLRVRTVKKANYPTNNVVDLKNKKHTNEFNSGYEYDIRFEAFNNSDVEISSVSESEISTSNLTQIQLFNKDTKDLFEEICGFRRSFKLKTSNYVDNIDKAVSSVSYNTENGGGLLLSIKSMAEGERSSVYFIQVANKKGNELVNDLGLLDDFIYKYANITGKSYFNRERSKKSYGIRRFELYIGDDTEDNQFDISYNGAPSDDVKEVTGEKTNSKKDSISIGNIIYTSSDINYSDINSVYMSYVLSDSSRLQINSQENFYYSPNKLSNENFKPPIIGIEGESVYLDTDGYYYIDPIKSDFGVKLTKNEIDTNSYYSIEENTFDELKIIRNKPVSLVCNTINGYDLTTSGINSYSGVAYGIDTNVYSLEALKKAASMQVPLIFSIDRLTKECPEDGEEFNYYKYREKVLAINPGFTNKTTGYDIYQLIYTKAKKSSETYVANNCYSFAKPYYNTTNKLVFTGLVDDADGNLTFYYPDATAFGSGSDDLNITTYDETMTEFHLDLSIKLFYRMLFGTNKTNPEFYRLYPKDVIESLNSKEVVCHLNDESDEYFYCPAKKHHLKFIYRGFTDKQKLNSKYGDYYITCENIYNGFGGGYNFFIRKTDNSVFPDREFYLHFVNDRTYEPNRNTEEDKIINYMSKYQIIGTELHLLKPYFKTFDIFGTIRYNANYDLISIKSNVENALKEKYELKSIKDIEVGNDVYRSDIFKTVLSVEGIISFDMEYFGYDYTNKEKYPDQKYSLNITSQSDSKAGAEFYIVSILAETTGKHGINITYEKADVSIE